MELQKKSELTVGRASFVVSTQLSGDQAPAIETRVLGADGSVVFRTSQDISELKPIFQNSQKVFARLEEQHQAVLGDLRGGRIAGVEGVSPPAGDQESDALAHAVQLLGKRNFDKAAAALKAVLETYPNCSEARDLLEVTYKAASEPRLPIDIVLCLKRGSEAFASGRSREAIESWKQCLVEEPENRRLQLLVLLATTWSPGRRQSYAAEILAPEHRFLSTGRPEEAQALLLVTQTLDGADEDAPSPERPSTPRGSEADDTVAAPDFEALLSAEPSSENDETIVTPPPAPPPDAAAPPPAPAARSEEPKETTKPEPRTPPAPRTASSRRPVGRARRSSPPWAMIWAAAVLLVVAGAALLWLLSRDRSVSPARLELAASLVSSGQYREAIVAYDGLFAEYGEHAGILLGRGRAKLASGDTGGGLADLERAHAIDADSAGIAEEIADVHYSQGNYPAAIGYYEKAFVQGAGSAEGRYRIAVSLVRQGRGEEAMEHLQAAITKDPAHGEAQFLFGQLLNERGRHEEAERALRASESHVEAGGDYLAQLGIALLEQQKLDEAEEIARDFIRTYPSDPRARSLLGEVYLSRKQYEPARAQLIQALRTDPREPRAQLALGRAWLAIGKSRSDAQDLAKAQQVLATAQGVHEGRRLLALGQVSLAEGKLEESQSLLLQSLERGAPALAVHLSLAEAKWRGNDLVGAAEELQRASGLSPGDPALALSLAITYFQLKDTSRAADHFLKAIQGIGVVTPPGEGNGPVVLPEPYVPVPERFNVNRAIRDAYQAVLNQAEEDPTATQLRALSENTTFIVGQAS